ncbi:peptidoglycan DD-metalloendopeptidase family protein [Salinibacillus xinjiangensis]|uniref:peptidoglycan DD-metalloendopeptidase family protein n=1 Tax=Salinibacillus xinjiangensis TaxID=1229268 RepID=UPI001890FC93|nr:peptidoglycan DD-metalloendopeptidase family protein [Salinibacillus xinjiangensis]
MRIIRKKAISIPKKRANRSLLKKVMITSSLALGLSIGSVHAAENDDLSKIYHVYVSGEHLGTVGDKEVVETFIEEQVNKEEQNYKGLNLAVNEDISYVSEFAFQPTYNNSKVLERLSDQITYSVKAQKLEIGGEEIGYFKDKETISELLKEFQSQFIPEDQTEDLDELYTIEEDTEEAKPNQDSDEAKVEDQDEQPEELSTGDSRIVDVSLTKDIELTVEKVKPNELLTVEQGLQMLEKDTVAEQVHKIEDGDYLQLVAKEYDLSMADILELNPDLEEDSILQVGQEIKVQDKEPIVEVRTTVEEIVEKEMDYSTEYVETNDLYVGEKEVKEEGQKGKKKIHYQIVQKNGSEVERKIKEEEVIKEPVDEVVLKGTKVRQLKSKPATKSKPKSSSGSGFSWPTAGGIITSYMGPRGGGYHSGIDISGVSNRTIYAAEDGVVSSAGYQNNGYGNRIVINHQNGTKTTYSHLSFIHVSSGQKVSKGQAIGVMGATGNSTGVHLHFEVYVGGSAVNPMSYY